MTYGVVVKFFVNGSYILMRPSDVNEVCSALF